MDIKLFKSLFLLFFMDILNIQYWKDLIYRNTDFVIALVITCLVYIMGFFINLKIILNYTLFTSLFLGIFTVNFTVFALSRFLIDNYSKIRSVQTKRNINSIFKIPIKTSIIGVILSLIGTFFESSLLSYLNPFLIFLIIYSIMASYYVFKFVYDISLNNSSSK